MARTPYNTRAAQPEAYLLQRCYAALLPVTHLHALHGAKTGGIVAYLCHRLVHGPGLLVIWAQSGLCWWLGAGDGLARCTPEGGLDGRPRCRSEAAVLH